MSLIQMKKIVTYLKYQSEIILMKLLFMKYQLLHRVFHIKNYLVQHL